MKTKKHDCLKCPKRDCCSNRANNLIEWALAQSRRQHHEAKAQCSALPLILAMLDGDYLEEE